MSFYVQMCMSFLITGYAIFFFLLPCLFLPSPLQVTQVTENLTGVSLEHEKLLAEKEHTEQTMNECIYQQLQNITSLTQARDDLQQMLEDMEAERDQLKDDVQENRERVSISSCFKF